VKRGASSKGENVILSGPAIPLCAASEKEDNYDEAVEKNG
jgi:hypothetical protein